MSVPEVLAHGIIKNEQNSCGYMVMPKLDVNLEEYIEAYSGLCKVQKVIEVVLKLIDVLELVHRS